MRNEAVRSDAARSPKNTATSASDNDFARELGKELNRAEAHKTSNAPAQGSTQTRPETQTNARTETIPVTAALAGDAPSTPQAAADAAVMTASTPAAALAAAPELAVNETGGATAVKITGEVTGEITGDGLVAQIGDAATDLAPVTPQTLAFANAALAGSGLESSGATNAVTTNPPATGATPDMATATQTSASMLPGATPEVGGDTLNAALNTKAQAAATPATATAPSAATTVSATAPLAPAIAANNPTPSETVLASSSATDGDAATPASLPAAEAGADTVLTVADQTPAQAPAETPAQTAVQTAPQAAVQAAVLAASAQTTLAQTVAPETPAEITAGDDAVTLPAATNGQSAPTESSHAPTANRQQTAAGQPDSAANRPQPTASAGDQAAAKATPDAVRQAAAQPSAPPAPAPADAAPRPFAEVLAATSPVQAATTNSHAPTASTAPTVPVQVATRIIERADGRAQRFEISLQPEELGRVDVRIEIGADRRVHAVLAAHDSAALTDLMRGQRALERALADAGIDLADGGVKFELAEDKSGRSGLNQSARDQQSETGVWRGFSERTVNVEADAAPVIRNWRSARLDLVA